MARGKVGHEYPGRMTAKELPVKFHAVAFVLDMRQRLVDPPESPSRMRAHPGREWLVVLSGTAVLLLGNRRLRVETNQSAEFPTMLPHAIGVEGGPGEVLIIFDRDARRGHQPDEAS